MYKKGIKIKRLENLIQCELIDEGKLMPYSSKMISSLYKNRTFRIRDYLHKASRILIDYAIEQGVSTIIIGRNKNWKQDLKGKMYHTTIQNFTKIPHYKLIQMIEYKAMLAGIKVVKVNESYTSGTSFLDNEKPTKKFYNKSRRKYRGLFISNEGIKINADVNAAMQILRKYLKDANFDNLCKAYPDFKKEILSVDVKNVPYKTRITTRRKSNLCNNR
jgi:putative transposase